MHPESINSADLAAAVLAEDLRVQRLIEDLLLLARADEAGLPLGRRPVDLDDLASPRPDTSGGARSCGWTPGMCRPVGWPATAWD